MTIDTMINEQAKAYGRQQKLRDLFNAVNNHPKNGVLITMRCGQEDRALLLDAIMEESVRYGKAASELGVEIRAHRVARNG